MIGNGLKYLALVLVSVPTGIGFYLTEVILDNCKEHLITCCTFSSILIVHENSLAAVLVSSGSNCQKLHRGNLIYFWASDTDDHHN